MSSRAGYWIGGALLALAVVAGIVIGGLKVLDTIDEVEHWQRASEGRATLDFEARGYTIYVEFDDSSAGPFRVGGLSIRDARSEAEVPIDGDVADITYDFPNHHGASVAKFRAPRPGPYVVTASDLPEGAELVFGTSVLSGIARALLYGLIAFLVGAIPGLALIITTGIRRSRASQPSWP